MIAEIQESSDMTFRLYDWGREFDPAKHNAVMHIDSDELGENVVSEVFQAGFMMDDKVVRYAIVQVAN